MTFDKVMYSHHVVKGANHAGGALWYIWGVDRPGIEPSDSTGFRPAHLLVYRNSVLL